MKLPSLKIPPALKSRNTLLGVATFACALVAAFGAKGYIEQSVAAEKRRILPDEASVDIVVASKDLPAGALVDPSSMAIRRLPKAMVPGGAIDPSRFGSLEGRKLTQPMRAGEPLLQPLVSAELSALQPLALRVSEGWRAMSIPVDEVSALSGMLQPGDRVDLYVTVRGVGANGAGVDRTAAVMQDIIVLATGQAMAADPAAGPQSAARDTSPARGFSTITVQVDHIGAQKLAVALAAGKLVAVLRNPDDRAVRVAKAMDLSAIGIMPPQPMPTAVTQASVGHTAKPAVASGVEIIIGGAGNIGRSGEAAPLHPGVGMVPASALPAVPAHGVVEVRRGASMSVSAPSATQMQQADPAVIRALQGLGSRPGSGSAERGGDRLQGATPRDSFSRSGDPGAAMDLRGDGVTSVGHEVPSAAGQAISGEAQGVPGAASAGSSSMQTPASGASPAVSGDADPASSAHDVDPDVVARRKTGQQEPVAVAQFRAMLVALQRGQIRAESAVQTPPMTARHGGRP